MLETYDPSRIGKRVSIGIDHWVYEYGEGEVIKFSTLDLFLGKQARIIRERHLATAQQYLGEYVLPSQIVRAPGREKYATIQPCVTGEVLSPEHMSNPLLGPKIKDLLLRHETLMHETGSFMDLIGHEGVFYGLLGNVWVVEGKPRLFDISMLEAQGCGAMEHIVRFVSPAILWRQNAIIRKYIGR